VSNCAAACDSPEIERRNGAALGFWVAAGLGHGRWGPQGHLRVEVEASACGPRGEKSPADSETVERRRKQRKERKKGEGADAWGHRSERGREEGLARAGAEERKWAGCWTVRGGERGKGAGPRVAHAGRERGGPGWKEERGGEECWAGLASCWVGLPSFFPSPFLLLFF
jgi:hypothetical protein